MKRNGAYLEPSGLLRVGAWVLLSAVCLVNFGGASIWKPSKRSDLSYQYDRQATGTLRELQRLGLLSTAPEEAIEELLTYQKNTRKTLAEILVSSWWTRRLGLRSTAYQATWYMANPFEVLPKDLQAAIQATPKPFHTRAQVLRWCTLHKASRLWRGALERALIETTPYNLWRASRGERPYAYNGEYLEPIVIERAKGVMEVREGHIATDPSMIPINSEVLLLVSIHGEERLLKVKAADVGEAIKGRHVDLPIRLDPHAKPMPYTLFPSDYIHNPTVRILTPSKISRDQKA